MASFAKDVTTPIDVPQVQAPDFSQSTSTAQDIVGLASFGMQIANRQNAKNQEAERQVKHLEATKKVDGLVSKFITIGEQKGRNKALIEIQKEISSSGDPMMSSFLTEEFAKRNKELNFGIDNRQEAKADEDTFDVMKTTPAAKSALAKFDGD